MFRSRAPLLVLPLLSVLLVPILSCDRGRLPGAPEGYNFRTAHIVWKLEGSLRGTMEEYLETSAYKDGQLHYKRYALISRYDQDVYQVRAPSRKVDTWIINDQGIQYNVMPSIQRAYQSKMNLDQYMRLMRTVMWREVLWGLIPRTDLTQPQRQLLRSNIGNMKDEVLTQVGAKITQETFLGHKVKRYEIPLIEGSAVLLLYGDIPLKQDLKFRRFNQPYHKIMTATKFELNGRISESAFTPPKSFKLIDMNKKIPGR